MANIKDFIKKIGSETVSIEEQQKALAELEKNLRELRQKREEAVGQNAKAVIDALKTIENRLNNKFQELLNTPAMVGAPGRDGKDGKDGAPGPMGPAGRNGKDGVDGKDGIDGKDGVGVVDAKIEFDGSLVITLSDGNEIDAGLIVPGDIAEQYNAYMSRGDILPATTGNSGKYLTTDGNTLSWGTVSISSTAAIGYVIDGGGAAITAGTLKNSLRIPFACTINSVSLLADQTGSIVIDIWKDTYANYPPTVADSICASAKPTLTSAIKSEDTTLTGWTKTISAGDVLLFNVDSASTVQNVTLILKVTKT